jgi:hypothetical protein
MTEIAAGFFSFTEVTRPDEHHAYNEWHMLDHMPEQYTLPGIAWGQRWVSTPACRAARAASGPLLDPVHYLTLYLVVPPVEESLVDFFRLGQELRDLDRFHQHRHAHLAGAHDIVARAAADRVLISAAAVPFRPNRGVHVRVDQHGDEAWLAGDHLRALVEVPGVAGAWVFRRRPGRRGDQPRVEPPSHVTVAWLDGPPLVAADGIAGLPAGADEPVLDGPFERVEPYRWDWFDAADAAGGATR